MDFENEESGIADVEKLDSGLPPGEPFPSISLCLSHSHSIKSHSDSIKCPIPIPSDEVTMELAEGESRQTRQALADRQQAAFQVCERMFNALLAWATTRDVRYLLAAQRSLTAVQNQQGDT